MIPFGFSAGILLREESADKQKSSLPAPEKQIRNGWLGRRFQPPSAGLPDKADCACNEKAHRLPALRNVARCRARLRFANTPLPRFAIAAARKTSSAPATITIRANTLACGLPGDDRRGNQMPQRDNERNLVEGGKAKSSEINRANDPEPFFELELGRAHSAFVAEPPLGCNPPLFCQSDRNERTDCPSLSLNIA